MPRNNIYENRKFGMNILPNRYVRNFTYINLKHLYPGVLYKEHNSDLLYVWQGFGSIAF